MREYVFSSILLLTLCTVSPFKIYLPGETTNDGGENKVHLIAEQVTALCVGLCLDRKLPDDNVATSADCRSWCREPLAAAALVAATVDVGDLAPGRHRPSTSPPVHLRLNPDDDGEKSGRAGVGRVSGMRSTSHRATTVKVMAAKRQVDPLLSCIEARCAGLGRSRYPGCVYSKCLAGWKRKRDNNPGRRSKVSRQLEEQGAGRQGQEEGRRQVWDNTLSGNVDDVRDSWSGDVKRSWNDVMQTCIEYKCRHTAPGTFDYNVCIQQACSKHMFGKR